MILSWYKVSFRKAVYIGQARHCAGAIRCLQENPYKFNLTKHVTAALANDLCLGLFHVTQK